MADEPQIWQEMDLLFLDPVADPIGYPALVRAVEVVPVHPIVHRLLDLVPGRQVQLWQDLPEVVLHHVVPLLGLTEQFKGGRSIPGCAGQSIPGRTGQRSSRLLRPHRIAFRGRSGQQYIYNLLDSRI